MSDEMDFPLFPRLPAELRRRVWQLCIPVGRTVEIDMPPDPNLLSYGSICCRSPEHATRRNAEIPPFTQACREAREVALEEGGRLLLCPDQDLERVPNRRVNTAFQNPWFWPGRDIVHLNWVPRCSKWYDMYETPIAFLMRCAEDAAGWSFMSRLLCSPPIDHDEGRRLCPRVRMRTTRIQEEVLDHLVSQDAFTVCLMTIIIHAPSHAVQDSSFFNGGANPIQLVLISDTRTFTAMHRLWESNVDQEKREIRDERTNRQFQILFDQEKLTQRVANFQGEVRELWLFRMYAQQWVYDQFCTITRRADILVSCEPLAETEVLSPTAAYGKGLKFDPSHPCVRAIIETMPTIHPVVMFRHCALECYNMTRENL